MAFDLVARLRLKDDMSAKLRSATRTTTDLTRAVNGVNTSTDRLKRSTDKAGSAFRGFGNAGRIAFSGLHGAARGVLGTVTSLQGVLLASGALYAAVVKPLKLSSDAEQANIAFTTMLGSAEKAKTFLTDLSNFANKTPFELPQLRDASKKLLAFGFASKDILPMMTGIGNASAGLGIGAEGVERIALALGQVKAKGRLQGDEAMQLTEAGIPVWDILAKKMKLTTAQVIKLSEKGLIPADKAITVLINGMNDRFPKMMDKQSKSLSGLYSTIKDTFSSKILTTWGEGIASALKPRLDRLTSWINNNGDTIDRWGKRLQTAAATGADWIMTKFDTAFSYVKGLIENPSFKNLTFGDKIKFIFEDARDAFNRWYEGGGKQQITDMASGLTDSLTKALGGKGAAFTAIGIDIGSKIVGGIRQGVRDSMPPGLLKVMGWATPQFVTDFWNDTFKGPDPETSQGHSHSGSSFQLPKNAGGLSRVPYNGYSTILHKDERVQTKSEADAYRSGRGSGHGSVVISGNTFNVRKDRDISEIAHQLARLIQQSEGAMPIG